MNSTAQNELLALRAIVGCLHESPEAIRTILDDTGLVATDFSNSSHGALFTAILGHISKGSVPDILELVNEVGGRCSRDLLVDVVSNWEMGVAGQRLRALKESSRLRTMVASIGALLSTVRRDGMTYSAAREAVLSTASSFDQGVSNLTTMDADVVPFLDRLDAVQRGIKLPLLPTGNAALDFHIGGLKNTLTVVGSLPGVGKSALLAGIAYNLIRNDTKIGIFSLEDEREWLLRRMLSYAAKVPLFVLGSRPMTVAQLSRVNDEGQATHEALKNLVVDDRQGIGTTDIVSSARRMIADGCRAIFVDHLGEIRLERSDRHDLDIIEALQNLRKLAKDYQVPVIVLCHLRRREGLMDPSAVPKLTDFAFSAGVERIARVALGLFRIAEDVKNNKPESLGVIVLKQTEGPSGHGFELNLAKLYGMVDATEPTAAAIAERKGYNQ